ncbi:MAG: hypothetical protein QNJ58_04080 [Desulfobacterales bacterium]|nr:hypothetical protein [Desulfobacterales bacterium]
MIKKNLPNLQAILLILMMAVPFLLYYFARRGSTGGVITFLAVMTAVMLIAMKK